MFLKARGYLVILQLSILAAGCAPKGGNMRVAYPNGNAAYGMRPGSWSVGEIKECQIASRSTQPPDARGDLLLCGADTLLAWNISWLRPDIKSQIYENTQPFMVSFRSAGQSSRTRGTWWQCQRRPEGIVCN